MANRIPELGGTGFPTGVNFRTLDLNDSYDIIAEMVDAGNQ